MFLLSLMIVMLICNLKPAGGDIRKIVRDPKETTDETLLHLRNVLSKFLKDNNRMEKRETGKVQYADKSKEKGGKHEPKWDKWSEWSSCSVSCGKGRNIRWRHCREACDDIQTEMGEKTCQLPACPNKLFGIIKL